MGNSFTNEFNKIYGPGGAASEDGGGPDAGTQVADNPGSGAPQRSGERPGPYVPPTAPTPPTFNKPNFYAPRQSVLQKTAYNPASTSHNQIQRFGVPNHY